VLDPQYCMERAFVVFLALASISPAAEDPDLKERDSKTSCRTAQFTHDCAVMANNLGSASFSAGKYRDAELLFARAISLLVAETPPSDDLAKAYHNLATTYRAEARYSDAAGFYESALELREALIGPSGITLVPILNELGLVYLELADYVRAERTLRRAMSIVLMYQAEHTTAGADTMNNLALADRRQGRLADAEELYRRALKVYEQTSDAGHQVDALNNLGRLLADEGQYEAAEQLIRRAIDEAQNKLGPTDPNTGLGLGNLGKLLIARRKYSAA
jgi:tetratricopeptide (TPR) repeat protein